MLEKNCVYNFQFPKSTYKSKVMIGDNSLLSGKEHVRLYFQSPVYIPTELLNSYIKPENESKIKTNEIKKVSRSAKVGEYVEIKNDNVILGVNKGDIVKIIDIKKIRCGGRIVEFFCFKEGRDPFIGVEYLLSKEDFLVLENYVPEKKVEKTNQKANEDNKKEKSKPSQENDADDFFEFLMKTILGE